MKKILTVFGLVALISTLSLASSFDSADTFKSVASFLTAMTTEYGGWIKGGLIAFALYVAAVPGGIMGIIQGGDGKSLKLMAIIGSLAIFGLAIGFQNIMTNIVIPVFQ